MNKAAIADLLVRANAFAPFRFLNRAKLPILMYHRFSRGEEFGKTSRHTFETHLRYLTRHYKIISLSEAVARVRGGEKFPERSAVITIDDGYRDFYEVAFPLLRDFAVPATIYVVTEFVAGNCWIWTDKARYLLVRTQAERLSFQINGRIFNDLLGDTGSRLGLAGSLNYEMKKLPDDEKNACLTQLSDSLNVPIPEQPPDEYAALTWDQARILSGAGIEIGSHTASHPILTNVGTDRLETELESSNAAIQRELDSDVVHFCYPNGNVSQREKDAAVSTGYASAVTTEIKLCVRNDDPYMIPRLDAEPEMRRLVQATSGFDQVKTLFR